MSLLLAMCGFSLAMSLSPGPVNMIIISSGASNGFRNTMPFVSGATIGFTLLLICTAFGFYQIAVAFPRVTKYVSILGALFIIYMGVKIAMSTQVTNGEEKKAPTFVEGFLLQWLNPKAWIACVSGVSLFSRPESVLPILSFILVYFFICYASLSLMAVIGDRMRVFLSSRRRLRIFNFLMASALIATALYLLAAQFRPAF